MNFLYYNKNNRKRISIHLLYYVLIQSKDLPVNDSHGSYTIFISCETYLGRKVKTVKKEE